MLFAEAAIFASGLEAAFCAISQKGVQAFQRIDMRRAVPLRRAKIAYISLSFDNLEISVVRSSLAALRGNEFDGLSQQTPGGLRAPFAQMVVRGQDLSAHAPEPVSDVL